MAVLVDLDKSSWGTDRVSLIGMDGKRTYRKKKSKTGFIRYSFRSFAEKRRREISHLEGKSGSKEGFVF